MIHRLPRDTRVALTLVLTVTLTATWLLAEVFLPGTQPQENGIELAKVQQCKMCHSRTKNGEADPTFSWEGGMMAQAARDPVFRAALAIANQDIEGVGEYCLRCHTPRGWLEGRSTKADGSSLLREDMHGVSCDACHRLVDPKADDAGDYAKQLPPGYGNAMMVADPGNVVYGPYGDASGAMPHDAIQSKFHASSELCGTCHNVSHPLQAEDVNTQPPYAYGPIERTYSEWLLSDFAKEGGQTCQQCHYPAVEGGGVASRFGSPQRDYFVMHGPVGGSTWVQKATDYIWQGRDLNPKALEAGRARALKLLKTSAELNVTFEGSDKATLRITNLTGHKLPTGYPEGRRMWVNVQMLDASGKVLKEIGRYGEKKDTVLGESIDAPTLLDPEATRVYECLPGISAEAAKTHGKEAGSSFHFVLNDMIVKDNRIPPKGFNNKAFEEHHAQPIGATYADGQHWDDVPLDLAAGTKMLKVRLMYQSVSWEYVKFLADENRTDDWGKRLLDAWRKTGQCPPEVMAETTVVVK